MGRTKKALLGLVVGAALVLGVSTPAQAATLYRSAYCGSQYGAVSVSNYLSSYSAQIKAYNASTGAYWGSYFVPGGSKRTWYTSLHNVNFVVTGHGIGASTFCSW
jgi:hypothetical protein